MVGNETYKFLTLEEALGIKSESERYFAVACLEVGCILYYQIAIDRSIIDFLVINPRIPKTRRVGKLVEVTLMWREELNRKNRTGLRKQHQIANMKESGLAWTILYRGEIERLRQRLGEDGQSLTFLEGGETDVDALHVAGEETGFADIL